MKVHTLDVELISGGCEEFGSHGSDLIDGGRYGSSLHAQHEQAGPMEESNGHVELGRIDGDTSRSQIAREPETERVEVYGGHDEKTNSKIE